MAKVLCVLYDDPVTGYPTSYARDEIPMLERYPDGQTMPTPRGSTSRPALCSAASPASLGCEVSSRRTATRSSSPRTRTARTPCFEKELARRRHRDLAAVLARLPDGGADREGPEAQAGRHRRHRLGSCRPAGGDRAAASPSPR